MKRENNAFEIACIYYDSINGEQKAEVEMKKLSNNHSDLKKKAYKTSGVRHFKNVNHHSQN